MTYNELWRKLAPTYGDGEAKAIARMVYEVRFGLTTADLFTGKDTKLSADNKILLREIAQRLLQQEPIQYILGEAEFGGRTFHVEPAVLIPRPETYELCMWILEEGGKRKVEGDYNILDIGTGSGCIACTLAAEIPNAEVTAWDISDDALRIASENAKRTNVNVSLEKVDALNIPHSSFLFSHFSIIVSNPPYICNKEREAMEQNVLDYEPHEALFVPDEDPLLFYRAIAEYGKKVLKPDGWLYFEINPLYAEPLRELLHSMSYHDIECKDDQYGKQRMIRARR